MSHFRCLLQRVVLVLAAVSFLLFAPLLIAQSQINPYAWTPVNSSSYTSYSKNMADQGPTYAAELHVPKEAKKEYEDGMSAAKKDNYKQAEEHLAKATSLYPPYSSAFAALGTAYARDHENAKAEAAFSQALKLNPYNYLALHNLSSLQISEGRLNDAAQTLRSMCIMYPNDIGSVVQLGYLQLQMKDDDAAMATAADLKKGGFKRIPFVHLMDALSLERKGDKKQAAKEYREYLKKPENPQGKALAEKGLARVEGR